MSVHLRCKCYTIWFVLWNWKPQPTCRQNKCFPVWCDVIWSNPVFEKSQFHNFTTSYIQLVEFNYFEISLLWTSFNTQQFLDLKKKKKKKTLSKPVVLNQDQCSHRTFCNVWRHLVARNEGGKERHYWHLLGRAQGCY